MLRAPADRASVDENRSEVVTLTTWQERSFFEAFRQRNRSRARVVRSLQYHSKIHFLSVVAQAKA
jgi:hypothetical protein